MSIIMKLGIDVRKVNGVFRLVSDTKEIRLLGGMKQIQRGIRRETIGDLIGCFPGS